jgi:hypothetical protein
MQRKSYMEKNAEMRTNDIRMIYGKRIAYGILLITWDIVDLAHPDFVDNHCTNHPTETGPVERIGRFPKSYSGGRLLPDSLYRSRRRRRNPSKLNHTKPHLSRPLKKTQAQQTKFVPRFKYSLS